MISFHRSKVSCTSMTELQLRQQPQDKNRQVDQLFAQCWARSAFSLRKAHRRNGEGKTDIEKDITCRCAG